MQVLKNCCRLFSVDAMGAGEDAYVLHNEGVQASGSGTEQVKMRCVLGEREG